MKVTISVPGTFHAFELAEGLYDQGALKQVFTTHPSFTISTNLPSYKISTHPIPEFIYQIGNRLDLRNKVNNYTTWNSPFVRYKFRLFDKIVAGNLSPPQSNDEIFLGFAGAALQSLKRANELGYTTVVERSSVDIRTQAELLSKEFSKVNDSKNPISERHIQIEEQEYQEADYIVVPSSFAKNSFNKREYKNKIVNIPLGDDPKRTSVDQIMVPEGVNEDEEVFLYAGAVSLQKGVQYLLDAWEKNDLIESHLVLVGPVNQELKDQVASSDGTVHAVGWQDNIDEWYAGADYFVFPSMQDGFAQVVLEALFHGLPVVVSENTGAKDCVREGIDGYIIPSGDSDMLQKAMMDLKVNNWDRDDIANYAQNTYSVEDYIQNILDAYTMMANPKSSISN